MENISVEIRSVGGAQIITLEGRLDAAVALEVREQLKGLIDGGDVHLVFDLEGIGFVDSTGLSVLITALKTASARGGDVVLMKLTPAVRSIFELTRLHNVFRIYDDEEAALQSLQEALQS